MTAVTRFVTLLEAACYWHMC